MRMCVRCVRWGGVGSDRDFLNYAGFEEAADDWWTARRSGLQKRRGPSVSGISLAFLNMENFVHSVEGFIFSLNGLSSRSSGFPLMKLESVRGPARPARLGPCAAA